MWAEWGSWSVCPVTCGRGAQFRNRECNLHHKKQLCIGNTFENKSCKRVPCQGTYLFFVYTMFAYVNDQSNIYIYMYYIYFLFTVKIVCVLFLFSPFGLYPITHTLEHVCVPSYHNVLGAECNKIK